MKGVSYEVFVNNVKRLESAGIIRKTEIVGYKKTFRKVLEENNLIFQDGKSLSTVSALDDCKYCFTSGAFSCHLAKQAVEPLQYLKLVGIRVCEGYVQNFKCHGKDSIKFFEQIPNGKELYFIYRSVLTSVSSDYRKLMFYYGITEEEAKNIAAKKHQKYSKSHIGEKNSSYGKRGLSARCFQKFKCDKHPELSFSEMLNQKKKEHILAWASEKGYEGLCYEDVKFKFYSEMFKNIHKSKGKEYAEENGISSIEEGIYLFNKYKSLKSYNAKSFLEQVLSTIQTDSTEEQEVSSVEMLLSEDYANLLKLCYEIRGFEGYKHSKISYHSEKFGDFNLRSKLEKGVIFMLDHLDVCESVKYENIRIHYFLNDKKHTYIPDFDITLKSGKRILIEVKPYCLSVIPEGSILVKKLAAENYAKHNRCVYVFITEKDLKYDLLRKKLQSL